MRETPQAKTTRDLKKDQSESEKISKAIDANERAKVRESLDRPESRGAMGASTSSFEKDKQKLIAQIQLFITTLSQNNPQSERLRPLIMLSSTISQCNTESQFRDIEKQINPEISRLSKSLEIKNLEKEKAEKEAKAKAEKKIKKQAEAKAEKEAEAKAEKEAKAKAEKEAEAKSKGEAKAKAKLEAQLKREAEDRAKREAEEKAIKEAEERAIREAEEKALKEAEAKAKREIAKQQKRAEYIERTNLEKMNGIISEVISRIEDKIIDELPPEFVNKVVDELVTKFVDEELSRIEKEDRIKSEVVAEVVNRIEDKIIDELLTEYVNKVVDELVTEYVNKVFDEFLTEYINKGLTEVATEGLNEIIAQQKAEIVAENLNEVITEEKADEPRSEIEAKRLKVEESGQGQEFINEHENKNESELRARVESELRDRVESELRARVESELRARVEDEYQRKFKSEIMVLENRLKEEIEETKAQFEQEKEIQAKKEAEIKAKEDEIIKAKEDEIKKIADANEKLKEIVEKNTARIKNLKREIEELKLKSNPQAVQTSLEPNPNIPPLAQAPKVSLNKRAEISQLNDKSEIEAFLSGKNPATGDSEKKIQKFISKNYERDSLIVKVVKNFNNAELKNFINDHQSSIDISISNNQAIFAYMMESVKDDPEKLQKIAQIARLIPNEIRSNSSNSQIKINEDECYELILSIIANKEISSADKIKKIDFIKAFTSDDSWEKAINEKKDGYSILQLSALSGDPILVEHLSNLGAKIDKLDVHRTILTIIYGSRTISSDNKPKILREILNSFSDESRDAIFKKRNSGGYTLLDFATKFDESFSLTLTSMGAKIGDCKRFSDIIKYAYKSNKFEEFVENARKNKEGDIFGSILGGKCENLIHHLSCDDITIDDKRKKLNIIRESMHPNTFLYSINQKDTFQYSPLDYAIIRNDTMFAKELIENGAEVSDSLRIFYNLKKLDMMKAFCQEGLIKFQELEEKGVFNNFKEFIASDPANADHKINFLAFVNHQLQEEQKTHPRAQETSSLPNAGLGVIPNPPTNQPTLLRRPTTQQLGSQSMLNSSKVSQGQS